LDEGDGNGAEEGEDKKGNDKGGGFFAGGFAAEGAEEFAHWAGGEIGWMA